MASSSTPMSTNGEHNSLSLGEPSSRPSFTFEGSKQEAKPRTVQDPVKLEPSGDDASLVEGRVVPLDADQMTGYDNSDNLLRKSSGDQDSSYTYPARRLLPAEAYGRRFMAYEADSFARFSSRKPLRLLSEFPSTSLILGEVSLPPLMLYGARRRSYTNPTVIPQDLDIRVACRGLFRLRSILEDRYSFDPHPSHVNAGGSSLPSQPPFKRKRSSSPETLADCRNLNEPVSKRTRF